MDDDLQLERELKALQPSRVPAPLQARIAAELEPSAQATPRRRWAGIHWLWALPLPAAAAAALLFAFWPGEARNASGGGAELAAQARAASKLEPPILKPVAAENVLVSARDEGLITLEDGTPARRERLQYVDTFTWKNPRNNASLRWSVPREEVRVVPVSFQ